MASMDCNCSTVLEDVVTAVPFLPAQSVGPAKANITKTLPKQAELHLSIITRGGGTHNGDDHGALLALVAGHVTLTQCCDLFKREL